MKYFFTYTFIIIVNNFIAQNFNTGYKDGFQQGFCMDKVNNTGTYLGCVAPFVTPPYPRATESINNYLDGYNRGLINGIKTKENENKYSDLNYRNYIPEYKPFVPDLEFYEKIMKKKSEHTYSELKGETKIIDKHIHDYVTNEKKYNILPNIELRKKFFALFKENYDSFKFYPDKIPNGVYNVTIFENNSFYTIYENAQVIVQDNKIISATYKIPFMPISNDYIEDKVKIIFPKAKQFESAVLLGINNNSNNIVNGVGKYSTEISVEKLIKYNYLIYFNDYIRDYNNCLEKLEKLKKERFSKNLNKKVLDGWQTAIMTNNLDFFDTRKVYVQNNKVIKWINMNGDEIIADGGGEINFLNTTLIHIWPRLSDKVIFENTFLYKEVRQVLDIYFE